MMSPSAPETIGNEPATDLEKGLSKNLLAEKTAGTHLPELDSSNGFIFGLRSGFASQMIGILLVYGFDEKKLSTFTESLAGLLLILSLWILVSVVSTVQSEKLFSWLNQPVDNNEGHKSDSVDLYLFYGCLIGMYMAWILCDVVFGAGLMIMTIHSGLAALGHLFLQHLKKKEGQNFDLLDKFGLA